MMFGYLPPACEIVERVIVTVGEALLRRLGHDYDHEIDDELRDCANCGEPVAFLSSRDWCDGCEEAESEVREPQDMGASFAREFFPQHTKK